MWMSILIGMSLVLIVQREGDRNADSDERVAPESVRFVYRAFVLEENFYREIIPALGKGEL